MFTKIANGARDCSVTIAGIGIFDIVGELILKHLMPVLLSSNKDNVLRSVLAITHIHVVVFSIMYFIDSYRQYMNQ